MITENEVDMTRSKNGKQSPHAQPAPQPSPAASVSVKPNPGKHQSTPDELKAWVESTGLQPPR